MLALWEPCMDLIVEVGREWGRGVCVYVLVCVKCYVCACETVYG